MKLYTVQSLENYNKAKEIGYLFGRETFYSDDETDYEVFLPAYEWMRKQLVKRINSYTGNFPIWAWINEEDWSYTDEEDYLSRHSNDIKLILEVPEDRILVSNYGAWHAVLNKQHLDFDVDKCTQEEKEKSWELIFDLDNSLIKKYGDTLQVCIEKVYLNEIIKIIK